MFGTLINDVEHKESLTFVENTDPASALSLSRREKPHTSCKFCRARKIRCSGQSTGCDRCVAVGAECQYPGREPRRRKTQPSSSTAPSITRRNDELSTPWGSSTKRSPDTASMGDISAPSTRPQTADAATNLGSISLASVPTHQQLHHHSETTTGNHQIEQWLSGSSTANGGLDDWLDFDMLTTTPLSQLNERMEIVAEDTLMTGMTGMAGESDMMTDLDFDSSTTSTFPSPSSLPPHPHNLLSSPFSPLSPLPHISSRSQQPASGSNSTHSDTRRPPHSDTSTPNSQLPQPPHPSPRTTPSPLETPPCTCLHLAARLLEDLNTTRITTPPSGLGLDTLLHCFRRALINCASILECTACAGLSENNMLLAMAGSYMATVCERIVDAYVALRREHEVEQGAGSEGSGSASVSGRESRSSLGSLSPPPTAAVAAGFSSSSSASSAAIQAQTQGVQGIQSQTAQVQDMWFSNYRIESAGERMQVLRCLVKVQMSEFAWILERLKVRAGERKGQLSLVAEAEKRFREVRRRVRRGAGGVGLS